MSLLRSYYSLGAAADLVGCKPVDILHLGVQQKLEIMFAIPDFIDVKVFVESETIALPPFIGLLPRLLVLSPESCLQIEMNGACLKSDFRHGYIVTSDGCFNPMPVHYGRPQLMKQRCYWRTFQNGDVYFNNIAIDKLVIKGDDLQALLKPAEAPAADTSSGEPETISTKPNSRRRRKPQATPTSAGMSSDTEKPSTHSVASESSKQKKAARDRQPAPKPNSDARDPISTTTPPRLTKVLRIKQVRELTGLSGSTIYNKMNPKSPHFDSTFPQRFKLSPGVVVWYESEIVAWLELRRTEK